jgi:hypothetical protein
MLTDERNDDWHRPLRLPHADVVKLGSGIGMRVLRVFHLTRAGQVRRRDAGVDSD